MPRRFVTPKGRKDGGVHFDRIPKILQSKVFIRSMGRNAGPSAALRSGRDDKGGLSLV